MRVHNGRELALSFLDIALASTSRTLKEPLSNRVRSLTLEAEQSLKHATRLLRARAVRRHPSRGA